MKRYKPYKNRVEHAAALAARYYAREPVSRDEWLHVVADGINVGRQLAAMQWKKRLQDAEQRIANLAAALGKRSRESTNENQP